MATMPFLKLKAENKSLPIKKVNPKADLFSFKLKA